MKWMLISLFLAGAALQASAPGQSGPTTGPFKVVLANNPYNGSREAEISPGPAALEGGGLADALSRSGCEVVSRTARLTAAEEKQYGAWNHMGMANAHLAGIVTDAVREKRFPVGLLANCNSLLGMLGGLQHSGPGNRPLRVGLVWIDAHADFNTPETTLSGMLGGMPVAVATGLCLGRYRTQSGLDPALPYNYVTTIGLRDVDPLEQELLDRHQMQRVSVGDLTPPFAKLHDQMNRLAELTDCIYVHVDMDVLDPAEVPGHSLNVAGGPGSGLLAEAITALCSHPKAAAFGVASYPSERDPEKISLRAAYALIQGAIRGARHAAAARAGGGRQ